MPVNCQKSTCGGKGNFGMFFERSPNICAAGLPTQEPDNFVRDSLEHYLLKDEVDALLSDAIIPPPKPRPRALLRRPIEADMRFAGPYCDVRQLVNPPIKTKFQTLVDDFKETTYSSYWKRPLGCVPDAVPMLPEGFDMYKTFGKKTPSHGCLYDIIMPKDPYPDKTPRSKCAGIQLAYNYCKPAFNPHHTFGHRTHADKRGTYARCCLTDDRVTLGTGSRTIINTIQSNFQDATQPRISTALAPNDNLSNVPKGHSFGKLKPPGNLPECLTFCELNSGRDFFLKCLKHLNTLRRSLCKRFSPTFFYGFYRNLKHFDEGKSGWLSKNIVYNYCGTKLIRFDPTYIEPLLSMWQAFDGSKIEFKTFVQIINYREPSREIPKIPDLLSDCINFSTTYNEMVKPNQKADEKLMSGLPSGRYIDLDYPITPVNCSKADRTCLPHESDMKSCLCPSILTLLHVNHRDMYGKREPQIVRRVFEATGEVFTDERFNALWEEAKKYHSEGWVCFETFRRVLEANPKVNGTEDNKKQIQQ